MGVFSDNALTYAAKGFRITPVAMNQKHPCIKNWRNVATNDPATIEAWRQSYTAHNIGAVTGCFCDGFLIVVDQDVKHPPINGVLTRQKWELLYGPLPETLTAKTPSGGEHLYFIADREGLSHHAPTSGGSSGIDIQADGDFIMLPPSTVNGKAYSFVNPECRIAHATDAVYRFLDYVAAMDSKAPESPVEGPESPSDAVDGAIQAHERKRLTEALNAIPCDRLSYDDWIHVGMALRNSGASVDVWDSWSKTDSGRYNDGECQTKWRTFGKTNWNTGTIYRLAKQYGYRPTPVSTRLICAADVDYEPPRWLMAPYFQRGKGTLIQGDNGSGKTAFMMAVAAHVTTGRPLIDAVIATPGDVLILSVEDDLPVLRGRLEANGADLSRCHFMGDAAGLTFNSPEVESAIQEVSARLIIFDPLQAFLGARIDLFRANETRPELAKLFEMCSRHDCACAIISHMGKQREGRSAVNRSLGSVDIAAAMRSIIEIGDDPTQRGLKVAAHVKCSNAPRGQSIAYTIGDRGGVHWQGYSLLTADDLITVRRRKETGVDYEQEPLVLVFRALIAERPAGGFWTYGDVKKTGAELLGFPPFDSVGDLRTRLDSGLARELQMRENLIVTHGERSHGNARGLTISRYQQRS